jgi:dGTPase
MNWQQLLSRKRVSNDAQIRHASDEPTRSAFEKDWDRILFSTAFRRMHDKTQIFPLPDDDVVHSRLTHSLEVASVGRSLGKLVGQSIAKRTSLDQRSDFDLHDVGDVVAAACLAHDIGNPPFGHAGEDAIAAFFRSPTGVRAIASLPERERADLQTFEGNAQGFRLLTRLQLEADNGLHLTAATLGAFSKYPSASGDDLRIEGRSSSKKHGFFQREHSIFSIMAKETGLVPMSPGGACCSWSRHPLAFLVEAADDICYSILDIEDGVRLGFVKGSDAEVPLSAIASKAKAFLPSRLANFSEPRERIGYLPAMAIGRMIEECGEVFLSQEDAILHGTFDTSLADVITSRDELKKLRALARDHCYRAPEVIEIELAGYEALGGLLEHFVPAALMDPARRKERPEREQKAFELLRGRGVDLESPSLYERLLRVTDFVSGMTDRHALATYRRLKGIAIPGRAG